MVQSIDGPSWRTGDDSPKRSTTLGKVVVVGSAEAGKSTLVGALCQRPLNLEVRGRTVALDHGMMRRGALALSLVGVPGQERFAGVREALVKNALGAIWVHPAGELPHPATCKLLANLAVPYVVCRNRRAGEAVRPWRTPAVLAPPQAVVEVDLALASPPELGRLADAIWKLAALAVW
jgi:hypothetical protein